MGRWSQEKEGQGSPGCQIPCAVTPSPTEFKCPGVFHADLWSLPPRPQGDWYKLRRSMASSLNSYPFLWVVGGGPDLSWPFSDYSPRAPTHRGLDPSRPFKKKEVGEGPGQVSCIDSGNLLCLLLSPVFSPQTSTAPHTSFLESVLTGSHQDCLIETPSEVRLKFSSLPG